jgi:hypothetical protein
MDIETCLTNGPGPILVVWDPRDGQYFLSGISQLTGRIHGEFLVPLDSDSGVLGFANRRRASIAKVRLAPYDRDCPRGDDNLFGYPVHSACWQLIQRIIGSNSEEHLELLMKALRQRYRELLFGARKSHADLEGPQGVYTLHSY